MSEPSIFYKEWLACLQAHYRHVIRVGDWPNEASLRRVLLEAGFSPADLEAIRQEATSSGPLAEADEPRPNPADQPSLF